MNGFTWFNARYGIPKISVASYGLTFSKAAIDQMGVPEYVLLGYNGETNQIAVRSCSSDDERGIDFAKRERQGNIRINNKELIAFIEMSSDGRVKTKNRAQRYACFWNKDDEVMIIDLNKPLGGEEDAEAEEVDVQ